MANEPNLPAPIIATERKAKLTDAIIIAVIVAALSTAAQYMMVLPVLENRISTLDERFKELSIRTSELDGRVYALVLEMNKARPSPTASFYDYEPDKGVIGSFTAVPDRPPAPAPIERPLPVVAVLPKTLGELLRNKVIITS
jgi:hypothetical protein